MAGAVAVGIDLGTTNSCVAVYKNGKVEVIQNEENCYVIPSWVGFTDNGIITGYEAKDEAHKYVRSTVFEAKRLIGQRYNDEKVQADIKRFPYEVFDDSGNIKIKVSFQEKEEEYFPEEISAFVLQKLKDLAQSCLGQDVSHVVVTVPAYFNDYQRQATKDAAIIAGFKIVNVINEPTAAALAFSYHAVKPYRRNVVVYDFGGGTFDVSVVRIGRGKCEVKATKGSSHLGGTDIDTNLVNFIKEDFRNQFGEDIEENEALLRRLRTRCEKIKEKLSGAARTINIEMDDLSGKDYTRTVSRSEFERLNFELFESTMKIVEDCLRDAALTKDEIDDVVLVGGSSRIPKIQQMLKEYFGDDKINKGVNPDEAVAYGAAIHATNLLGNKCEVEDVISLSLGIAVLGYDRTDPYLSNVLIPRNTSIPTTFTRQYHTSDDNQQSVLISVHQGESSLAKNNFELGSFVLSGLTEGPAMSVKFNVCFNIDAEGILNVTASEVGSLNVKGLKIDVRKNGLTPMQIEKRIAEIEKHRAEASTRKEFVDAKHQLETLCINTAAKTDAMENDDFKDAILEKCNDVCSWLENISIGNQDELQQRRKEIEDLHNVLT